ncbi:50S ribosomal protein L6 [Patescibacteria group bacterium]|nr:50S ribosomal protein L6 [Patescibacteria group bacterium]
MSRIGKKPIEIPQGVTVDITDNNVFVKGPKGEISFDFEKDVEVKKDGDIINVEMVGKSKNAPALWGLTRAMISNLIEGVTEGFEKKLELVGVGYRAKQVSPNEISMTLGFSHPVEFKSPEGVEIKVEDNTHITVLGIDKHLVGLTAANIRKIRKPEPYKGKGIRYEGEVVRRKAGKAGKIGSGA